MGYFSKEYRHLKSKILHNLHRLLFVFLIFLAFWYYFFPISPKQTCQKILNIFVVLYCTDYRFYQRILKNSSIFIKKIRDILNTKHFLSSIVYYLLFWFFSIFDIFFFYFTCLWFLKKFKIFVLLYCMDTRFYQKILQNYSFSFKKNLYI